MPPFPFLASRSSGWEGATPFSSFVSFLGYLPETQSAVSGRYPSFLRRDSRFFWISTPLSSRHLWVLSILLNTSEASFTLSFTWPGLFLRISCWMTLKALDNVSIFSLCSLRSWRTSFYPSAPGEAPKSTFLTVFTLESIHLFTSTSRVEERVGIVGNGCTLGQKSYPSSLRPNLRLAGPGIHRQTGLARSHTGSDTYVQCALPDQGPKGAGFWSRMEHYFGRAGLTSASPPRGPGKTLLVDEALPGRDAIRKRLTDEQHVNKIKELVHKIVDWQLETLLTLFEFQEDHSTPFQKIFWVGNSWFMHHDNAPSHTALAIRDLFAKISKVFRRLQKTLA